MSVVGGTHSPLRTVDTHARLTYRQTMKQFSIKELSRSPSKIIAQAPCEILNRGEVVAVIEKKRRKLKIPDYDALRRKVWGKNPKPIDFENLL